MIIKTLSLLILFSSPAVFAEGAGARGGGTGIICDSSIVARTLEEFETEKNHLTFTLPEKRDTVRTWLKTKLLSQPVLLSQVIENWEHNGSFSEWKVWNESLGTIATSNAESADFQISKKISAILALMQIHLPKSETFLIHDDFAAIPSNCHKVQLSLLYKNTPYRTEQAQAANLSELSQRILEIHEALYQVGMNHYEHRLPIRTREVIISGASGDDGALESALKKFVHLQKSKNKTRAFYASHNTVFLLNQYTHSGFQANQTPRCPLALSFQYDGEYQRVLSLEKNNAGLVTIERNPLPAPRDSWVTRAMNTLSKITGHDHGFHDPSIYFPEETAPIGPLGLSNLFKPFMDGNYILQFASWDYLREYEEISLPKSKDRLRDTQMSLGCIYHPWNPSAELDESEIAKVWNQILQNQ